MANIDIFGKNDQEQVDSSILDNSVLDVYGLNTTVTANKNIGGDPFITEIERLQSDNLDITYNIDNIGGDTDSLVPPPFLISKTSTPNQLFGKQIIGFNEPNIDFITGNTKNSPLVGIFESNLLTDVAAFSIPILDSAYKAPTPPSYAIKTEKQITINNDGEKNGDSFNISDDTLIYAALGFNIKGNIDPTEKVNADGTPQLDDSGRKILRDNVITVADAYNTNVGSNEQYPGLNSPQVLEEITVDIPTYDSLKQDKLDSFLTDDTQTIIFDIGDNKNNIKNATSWSKNFPAPGTVDNPTVVEIIGGGLTIPNNVNLSNYVIIVQEGDIKFRGSKNNLDNVVLIANDGDINLAKVKASDLSVFASGSIDMNDAATFAGDSLIASDNSSGGITFRGATENINVNNNIRVVSSGDITFDGAADTRGIFESAGDFTSNSQSTIYGAIAAKGDIQFNAGVRVVAADTDNITDDPIISSTVADDGEVVELITDFEDINIANYDDSLINNFSTFALLGSSAFSNLELPTISAKNGTVPGNLEDSDVNNPTRDGSYSDDYKLIDFTVGKVVTLDLLSSSFDTYLQLVDADTGTVIADDDDSGEGRNSMLRFTPVESINYIVRVTSYGSGATGAYNLNAGVGAPDLVITDATAPTTAAEGSKISLTWTTTNQGERIVTTAWNDRVYLSDNTIFDNSDRYVGSLEASQQLMPGESYISATDMALPKRVGSGKQYLLFVADYNNYVFEESETNNVRAVPIDITLPDLTVTGATAPLAVTVDSTAEISWTVLNQGNVEATHSWNDGIYLSDNQIFDAEDTRVSSFNSGTSETTVVAANTYNLTETVTIPKTALGSRYLLFVADVDNNHYETNESNNVKAIEIVVNAPDLIVSDATAPTEAVLGEEISVNWQVTNQGAVTADADWYDYFYLSDDEVFDEEDDYITKISISDSTPLAAGTNYSINQEISIPTDASPGSRYLLFVANNDNNNYQQETDKTNNFRVAPIIIKAPDIVITDTSTPITAAVGEDIELSYTVKNQGESATSQYWYDHIYLSTDTVYDDNDEWLHDYEWDSTPLAVDGTYTVENISVTLPDSVNGQPGNRYLLFITDKYKQQTENNEGNNLKAVPLTIAGDNADLEVIATTAPNIVEVKETISVSWTVKNKGTSDATNYNGGWYDLVYISSDNILDENDTYLGEEWVSTPLAANGEYTLTKDITIPQDIIGSQYLLFVTDRYNYQSELDETNNIKVISLEVKAPDLQVTNAEAPNQAYASAQIEVVWTVDNQGNGNASDEWYDSVYLSDDNTLSTDTDIQLSDAQISNLSPLASGTGYTVTQYLEMPSDITKGNKYLLFTTDYYNQQGELNEDNNFNAVPITIGDFDPNLTLLQTGSPVQNQNSPDPVSSTNPDLIVTEATIPATAAESSSIAVNWTVKNQGNVAADVSSWYDSVYLSNNTVFDDSDLYIGDIEINENLDAGETYSKSQSFTLPEGSGSGKWYLLVVTNNYNYQVESSDANNVYAVAIDITIPDLTIITNNAPSTAVVGETVSVSWTVENLGDVSASADWYDSVYISDDEVFNDTDTEIANFNHSRSETLASGETYIRTEDITIPNYQPGERYLLLLSDRGNSQSETDETNNVYTTPITITAPDLVVSDASIPIASAQGETISVSWTVANQGNVAANFDWYDSVYLSDDEYFDADEDQYVIDSYVSNETTLAAGANYGITQDIIIPTDAKAGSRYLLFVADNYNYQQETDKNNNFKAVSITIQAPDIVVTDTSTPATAAAGEDIELSYTVKNQGESTTSEGWYDYIYLSTDTVYDDNDEELYNYYWDSTPLAVDGTYTVDNINITLPDSVVGQPGNRFLLFITDKYEQQIENNEGNNAKAVPLTIIGDNADLEVVSATVPRVVEVEQTISVSWTVKNKGTSVATNDNGGWYDRVYISSDSTLDENDTELLSDREGSTPLEVDGEYTLTDDITIPKGTTGSQYLLFVTDYDNYKSELDEANNVKAIPIYVNAPDLVIINTTVPVKSYSDERIEVSWTVKNQGNASTNANWYDRIYLSNDATLDTNTDTQLKDISTSNLTPLAVDSEYSVSQLLTLPSNIPIGTRYLIFATDVNNYQGELNELNNAKAVPIVIGDNDPDLVVTAATAPDTAVVGESITVNWSVENQGNIEASSDWYDTIYLSDDNQLDDTDIEISSQSATDEIPLGVNASYDFSRSITIPNTATGNRYLIFAADAGKQQSERDEINNIRAIPIALTAPDLVVSSANTVNSTATWGETIDVSWTVTNNTTVTASATWSDQIYISDDTTLDGSDKFVATFSAADSIPLNGNSSYTQTKAITIPINSGSGSKYLLFAADANNAQGETDNSNNVKAIPFEIAAPNLQVTDLNAPTTATWGETINVSWDVTNQGTGAALADWSDYVYLSKNPTLDNSDIQLGSLSAAASSPLGASANYTLNSNITIPNVAEGNWYVLITTDNNGNQQAETSEIDNVRAISLEVKAPDLIVENITAPTDSIVGETIAVEWSVTNRGTGAALADWWDGVYLSSDENLDSSDTFIGDLWTGAETPLASGASYTVNRNLTLPNVASGTWYLLFKADYYNNRQAESNENNNIKAVSIELGAPDIELSAPTAPLSASFGETIEVGWTVTNTGNLQAPADWYDYVYLSDDAVFDANDIELGNLSAADKTPLLSGDRYTHALNVTIPNTMLGNKYLLFVADPDNIQGESNETNNIASLPITINAPDLSISTVTAPTEAILGETIDVSWTISNSDTGVAFANWYDGIYISDDATFDNEDTFITSIWAGENTPLQPGSSYTQTQTITVPNTTTGNRYLLFVSDSTSLQGETNESNNVKAVSINLGSYDLVPTITSLPTTATSGDNISLEWSVTNNGSAEVASEWVDRIYLSKDNTFDNSDLLLKEISNSQSLNNGESYEKQIDFNLPIDVKDSYYVLLVTDAAEQITELGKEQNNVAASPIQITLADYADLAVSNITVTESTIGNPATINVGWKVSNIGTGAGITDEWVDRIIASDDEVIGDNDDIILATFTHNGLLNQDEFYNLNQEIQLPRNLEGRFNLYVKTGISSIFENGLTENNINSAPNKFFVAPREYADLIVTDISTNTTTAKTGETVKLKWTVANQGLTVTDNNSWSDYVVLYDENDNPIKGEYYERIGFLTNGDTYERQVDFTIPQDLANGAYYFGVTAAYSSAPYESIFNNNNSKVSLQTIDITPSPSPNLVVENVATVSSIQAGKKIDVSWKVVNTGSANASGRWFDEVYLQKVGVDNPGTIYLGNFGYSNGLEANKFYERSEQFIIPETIDGAYNVIVRTNSTNSLYEAGATSDNIKTASNQLIINLPSRPDLQVSDILVPSSIKAGGKATGIEFTVVNRGTIAATETWYDNVYLSLDGNISGDDILIGSFQNQTALDAVNGNNSSYRTVVNQSFDVPRYFRDEAYIIVNSDANNNVNEYPRDNNNTKSQKVTVESIPPADLVTSNVFATNQAFEGSQIKVRYKVTNSGSGETDRDNWTDSIWLTREPNKRPSALNSEGKPQDILLSTFTHNGSLKTSNDLDSNNYYENTVNVTLPNQISGEWYITAWSDTNEEITEDTFDNNGNGNELNSNNYASTAIKVLLTGLKQKLSPNKP
ncbi:MAG: hypothetical protein IGS23_11675 [Rivularia sp. T60_A2020_040]|nr:hypothetical protein [Rivularia sp. T60_A2020_040]